MHRFFEPTVRRWPTVVAFAREVGCPEFNAREWVRADSIPATWFSAVVRAAAARGLTDITHEFLASCAEDRRISAADRPSEKLLAAPAAQVNEG